MKEPRNSSAYMSRSLSYKVTELNRFYPCLMVTGARQVGKSTLLQHMLPAGMKYVSLDDFQLADYARKDPMRFLEQYSSPLCIDEVQYAPDLFRTIKIKVDENRHPGMYWLTSSQRFNMMQGVNESLAGRIGIVDMYSLSQRELYGDAKGSVFNPAAPEACLCKDSICNLEPLHSLFRVCETYFMVDWLCNQHISPKPRGYRNNPASRATPNGIMMNSVQGTFSGDGNHLSIPINTRNTTSLNGMTSPTSCISVPWLVRLGMASIPAPSRNIASYQSE